MGSSAAGRVFGDRKRDDYAFYDTKEFTDFRDAYIKYVKKNDRHFSGYINLDVINNAQASYDSLKYMEKKGCHPLPVFHLGEDLKWLERYIKEGYKFICMGGITPNRFEVVRDDLDFIWDTMLTDKNGRPIIQMHGLAATSWPLLTRYPWWSVDSTSWRKAAAFGKIFIPHRRKGRADFSVPPYILGISKDSPTKDKQAAHFDSITNMEKEIILAWFKEIGMPLGKVDKKGEMVEWGVYSHHNARSVANMKYYAALTNSLPEWPWAFKTTRKKGLLI